MTTICGTAAEAVAGPAALLATGRIRTVICLFPRQVGLGVYYDVADVADIPPGSCVKRGIGVPTLVAGHG